eukprot:CAMPEP_0173383370 /NCGR_PEP_ID=MMETSP1356-20130122/5941_1 /TAXON_ID=77927 ORGANISM="Hemiselmis virescens, Strain PCC157" /NCGR_SAMPLE_ID=MMETSP1356 /ASSEMBLY_ACC=CAM_ASM_000847 /LENGTH=88 /DNA_ID=CAMNT_0014338203 /DNA_START=398 /DNA_END=661 /DNA_ORIENTATION=-
MTHRLRFTQYAASCSEHPKCSTHGIILVDGNPHVAVPPTRSRFVLAGISTTIAPHMTVPLSIVSKSSQKARSPVDHPLILEKRSRAAA